MIRLLSLARNGRFGHDLFSSLPIYAATGSGGGRGARTGATTCQPEDDRHSTLQPDQREEQSAMRNRVRAKDASCRRGSRAPHW